MDVDGDDALIGRQVFNLFNRLYYQNPNAWFLYANYISVEGNSKKGAARDANLNQKMKPGICGSINQ